MTIASEITRIQTNIADAYTAANGKGATMPVTENSDNLATCIASITTGSSPVISSLNVTPTTSAQTITAPSGVDGYSPVNVSAVTSSIDANIVAGNIKDGVTILGVTGNYQGSGGGSTRFGLSLDNYIGQVNNGVLGAPSNINGITFTGVTEVGQNALKRFVSGGAESSNSISGSVSFPDLITVDTYGMYCAFDTQDITSVNLSSLTTVGDKGLWNAFSYNSISGNLDLSSLTTIGEEGLYSAFSNNRITVVDLSSLTSINESSLREAFGNNQITSIDLSALTTVRSAGLSDAFSRNQITSVNLPALTTVGESGLSGAFADNQITSVDLSALTTVGENGLSGAFADNQIASITFTSLTDIGAFGLDGTLREQFDSQRNPCLTDVYFPALTTNSQIQDYSFVNMLSQCSNVTVHFPSNLQAVIGNWDSVSNGFAGENTTVLFDLPATE